MLDLVLFLFYIGLAATIIVRIEDWFIARRSRRIVRRVLGK